MIIFPSHINQCSASLHSILRDVVVVCSCHISIDFIWIISCCVVRCYVKHHCATSYCAIYYHIASYCNDELFGPFLFLFPILHLIIEHHTLHLSQMLTPSPTHPPFKSTLFSFKIGGKTLEFGPFSKPVFPSILSTNTASQLYLSRLETDTYAQ